MSYFLFALVILGNTTYGLSVLLKNPDDGQGEKSYLIHHLPWLIGSLGTLSLDLIVSFKEKKTWPLRLGLWALLNPTYMPHFRQGWACREDTSSSGFEFRSCDCVCGNTICSIKAPNTDGKLGCCQQGNRSVKAALVAPGGHVALCTPQKWWTEVTSCFLLHFQWIYRGRRTRRKPLLNSYLTFKAHG